MLLLQIGDLKTAVPIVNFSSYETFQKTVYLGGSEEWEYEFESADALQQPLYLATTIEMKGNAAEAREAYELALFGIKSGIRAGKADLFQQQNFFSYGEQSFVGFGFVLAGDFVYEFADELVLGGETALVGFVVALDFDHFYHLAD